MPQLGRFDIALAQIRTIVQEMRLEVKKSQYSPYGILLASILLSILCGYLVAKAVQTFSEMIETNGVSAFYPQRIVFNVFLIVVVAFVWLLYDSLYYRCFRVKLENLVVIRGIIIFFELLGFIIVYGVLILIALLEISIAGSIIAAVPDISVVGAFCVIYTFISVVQIHQSISLVRELAMLKSRYDLYLKGLWMP